MFRVSLSCFSLVTRLEIKVPKVPWCNGAALRLAGVAEVQFYLALGSSEHANSLFALREQQFPGAMRCKNIRAAFMRPHLLMRDFEKRSLGVPGSEGKRRSHLLPTSDAFEPNHDPFRISRTRPDEQKENRTRYKQLVN